jgi:hypothetical protein
MKVVPFENINPVLKDNILIFLTLQKLCAFLAGHKCSNHTGHGGKKYIVTGGFFITQCIICRFFPVKKFTIYLYSSTQYIICSKITNIMFTFLATGDVL